MQSLGFENYTEALKIYLAKYREVSCALKIGVAMCQPVCFFDRLQRLKEPQQLAKRRRRAKIHSHNNNNNNKFNSNKCMEISNSK